MQVLVGLEGDDWVTNVQVFCQKGSAHMLLIFAMNERFATYDRAVLAGIATARNWIDEFGNGSKTEKLCIKSRQLHEKCRAVQNTSRIIIAESQRIVNECSAFYLKMRSAISGRPRLSFSPSA